MRILAISGSLRRDSYNRGLLRAAAELLPAGVELEIWEGLKAVPPYDQDDDTAEAPAAVAELRAAVGAADAVLIATPEYNASIPGVLKNALDWVSGRWRRTRAEQARARGRRIHGRLRGDLGAGRAAQGPGHHRRPRWPRSPAAATRPSASTTAAAWSTRKSAPSSRTQSADLVAAVRAREESAVPFAA